MSARTCIFVKENSDQCQAAPLRESEYCFVHDPAYVEEMTEARRLGGLKAQEVAQECGASLDQVLRAYQEISWRIAA